MLAGPRLRWSVAAEKGIQSLVAPATYTVNNDLGEYRYSISFVTNSKNLFSSNIFIISASALFSVSVLMTAIVST